MKIGIHWRPELSGIDASTRDENGLRELFGEAETSRILAALAASNGAPVTLSVNGQDAGSLNLDFIDVEFRIIDEGSHATRSIHRVARASGGSSIRDLEDGRGQWRVPPY